jgi:cytoskeletal protein CcmA (bactofilin family)
MWSKSSEGKPSSQVSNSSAPVPAPVQTFPPSQSAPVAAAVAPISISTSPVPGQVAPAPRGTASTIAGGIHIRGDITGSSDLFIDGEVHGKIKLPMARVTVGMSGRVHADIEAREIVIEGSANGNLKAGESARIGSSGRVQGSVVTPRIGIDDGARLTGKVETTRADDSKSAPEAGRGEESEKLRPVSASAAAE